MNEKGKILVVMGVVIVLSGYVFNEIFMMLVHENNTYTPGTVPHPGPLPIATAWLFLIPVGFILIFISITLELRDRYRRTDPTETWDQ